MPANALRLQFARPLKISAVGGSCEGASREGQLQSWRLNRVPATALCCVTYPTIRELNCYKTRLIRLPAAAGRGVAQPCRGPVNDVDSLTAWRQIVGVLASGNAATVCVYMFVD